METIDVVILISYFMTVTLFGFMSGRGTKTTKEFFFAGQRYGWLVIGMSCVATVVGSYSFVKYSSRAYEHGFAVTQNYFNDWMWVPLFLGAWLPILWMSGVASVPEFFHKRFGPKVRAAVTALLVLYMVGYIGINFWTLGIVLNKLHPLVADPAWSQFMWSLIVAMLCAFYVTSGGQVSVIMTDLFQGALLLVAGFAILGMGVYMLQDHGGFWANFSGEARSSFSPLNQTSPPGFDGAGLFWQDGMANTAAFYFVNQGLMMRFLSAKNQAEGKKALVFVMLVLMPLAAIAVCGGGWIARAMETAGIFNAQATGDEIFIVITNIVTEPGVFGLIMAALTAALMSTADTLINATAAVAVNDVWRPYVSPGRSDSYYLKVARWASIGTAVCGILLVPVFMGFENIFDAHGTFTAAITPPLVVALILGMLWRKYTTAGALATLVLGTFVILLSMKFPSLIEPFSHGIDAAGEGAKAYKYIRACFGMLVCIGLGVIVSKFTKKRPVSELKNLVMGEVDR